MTTIAEEAMAVPPEPAVEGFWWLYVPLRFKDFALVVIVQEEPSGYRTLNDAVTRFQLIVSPA